MPERFIVLATSVPIIFGKARPSLVRFSSTKMTKWVRGDVASSIARAWCLPPVAFLAQSNEERDGWWGVMRKSEYDEEFPKQLAVHTYCGETPKLCRLEMELEKCWPTFDHPLKKRSTRSFTGQMLTKSDWLFSGCLSCASKQMGGTPYMYLVQSCRV